MCTVHNELDRPSANSFCHRLAASSLRPMALAAALSLAAAASSSIGSLTSCTSRRPYGELKHNYRTLYVPASLLSSPSAASLEWAESLCCVYTRVEEWTGEEMAAEGVDVVDSASKLRRYDGEEEWYAEVFVFAHRTHFSHMSHPTFPTSHLLILFF